MKNKKESINNKNVFPFTHLHRKIYILLEDIYGKTQFILLHLYDSFLAWQVT